MEIGQLHSVVEVACERFFGLSGYVSSARRSTLGVRNYERITMLSGIMHSIYIDAEAVAREYLKRCKLGSWDRDRDEESLKSWNLERIIDAEIHGKPLPDPDELPMEDLLAEFGGK